MKRKSSTVISSSWNTPTLIIAYLFVGYIYWRRGWPDRARLSQDRGHGSLILRKSWFPTTWCALTMVDQPIFLSLFSVIFIRKTRRLRYLRYCTRAIIFSFYFPLKQAYQFSFPIRPFDFFVLLLSLASFSKKEKKRLVVNVFEEDCS